MKYSDAFNDHHITEPLTGGLVLRRDKEGNVWTNCPHTVIHHSPTGFEFGYGGSGPADLALNVVEALLNHRGYRGERTKCYDGDCFNLASELHQDFKWHFIAGVDRAGARIPFSDMIEWIETQRPEYMKPCEDSGSATLTP